MDALARDQLVASFRAYLERDETASADAGPDDDTPPDLFSLLAELAALGTEVKLESRQVKSALDDFRSLFDVLRDTGTRLEAERERRAELERQANQAAQRDLLLELLELRDRLQAGHDQARRFRPGWLTGRATDFIIAMARGMDMNLKRLDETLARRGVRPLPALGQAFDPQTMHAVEQAHDPARRDGVVVGELRKGFLLDERLLRAAEVVVNRRHPPRDTGAPPPGVWMPG